MRNFLIALGLVLGITTALWAQVETPGTYGDAMRWYERSAKAGSAPAQFFLGLMHETGTNVEASRVQAVRWFRKAAEQGHALAQYRLATYHHFGLGIPVDFIKAEIWYRKAASQGVAEAAFNLAFLLENGLGAQGDAARAVDEAVKWYRQAAEAGLSSAQFNLGALFANGKTGVKKDLARGWLWLDAAAMNGEEGAAKSRDALAAQMSEDELKRARDLASARPHPKPKPKPAPSP
ncbi:MAG: sel1 repeat family protein [Rhodospirillales bacterium]|nr:sel1 repeat family protein [Rhodospirillales bacterium]